ncbi:Hpt domain-containing protein [Methylopila henanensis]|uniref:Hpt domain-containing protein n=1 Tax=Methylopila henanensis TaxID=873516 RepID=A0ABW4K1F1_9HYPH
MPDAPPAPALVPAASWGVPVESFTDHIVLRPPNRLKERATRSVGLRDKSDEEAILRAEQALELLSTEFDGWMQQEIDRLEAMRAALAIGRDVEALDDLYRSAHDLRGQSATFGFPLAGEIADGLCLMLEQNGPLPPQSYVDRHVEAIRAIVREDVRGREHPVAAEIVERLAMLRAGFLKPKV